MSRALPEDLDDLERALLAGLASLAGAGAGDPSAPLAPGSSMTGERLDALLDAQMASRHLDHTARWLRAKGRGFYTIGSAGHEANALVAAALRPTDPALLHYRSGGFYLARAQQVPGHDGVRDVLLGLLAAADEPIAGGRHKVFGHPDLAVIPQTSTIASHLPRAMGVAFAIGRARRLGLATRWPADALAVCSFGDASLNHSTAQGALNAAAYTAQQGMPMPVLFVCEDNGLGDQRADARRLGRHVAVGPPGTALRGRRRRRPRRRVRHHRGSRRLGARRPASRRCCTCAPSATAAMPAPTSRRPTARPPASAPTSARDPLLATARVLVEHGCATADSIVERYLDGRADVRAAADELAGCRPLQSAAEVMTPLSPRRPAAVAERAVVAASPDERAAFFGRLPEDAGPLTLAESINRTLGDLLAADPRVLVFGEDVGAKGGVYGVTRGLQRRAGSRRVFDTLLDEQSILGLALGAGVSGLVPIPEIQYLAYLHNAEDQLRGEAASLSFFSNGQYTNPLVVRIAGYGYQKGFGGHFHNDNGVAVLRDIPGLVIASPARAADAPAMLRTCVAAAVADGTVSVFLEPIALYHTRDLHEPGDDGMDGRVRSTRAMAERARPDRRGERGARRRRRARRHVGQRPVHVAARRRATGR